MKTSACTGYRKPTIAAIVVGVLSAVWPTHLPAQFYLPVIPGRLANDWVSTVPFTAGTNSAGRFQQVYDAAGFIEEGGNRPFLIHAIYFREDEGHRNGFSSRFPDFQINLSTTARSVDDLSPTFSQNVGPDDTAVVPRGPFQIGVSVGGGFSAAIGLAANPFYYDPSQGNLLLDIRNFGGGVTVWGIPPFEGPAYVDASNVAGDRVSSVYANSVGAASGVSSTMGLVTQFVITPVPEPSAVVLLLFGLVAIGAVARQRIGRER